jgi:hypothetical protein
VELPVAQEPTSQWGRCNIQAPCERLPLLAGNPIDKLPKRSSEGVWGSAFPADGFLARARTLEGVEPPNQGAVDHGGALTARGSHGLAITQLPAPVAHRRWGRPSASSLFSRRAFKKNRLADPWPAPSLLREQRI